MKSIIAGSTGLLGGELIRQSLRMPAVSSVVTLGRRPFSVQEGTDATKLKSVVVEDFGSYSDDVRKEFEGTNACIWTIAVTPSKAKGIASEDVTRVYQTYAVDGLRVLAESSPARPLRYVYLSGMLSERGQTKRPAFATEYCLMRGQAENMILQFGKEIQWAVEVNVVKPGLIIEPGNTLKAMMAKVGATISVLDSVRLEECAAAILDQTVNGFEKETIKNVDLRRIRERLLKEQ